ncbi:hypothetical protein GGR56DRAFT_632589 [Xylariaceae sp. FL0804]|nr:hypothetical protein GGR56DRAFT_632589 [Xylariaceae sp. FL0804]
MPAYLVPTPIHRQVGSRGGLASWLAGWPCDSGDRLGQSSRIRGRGYVGRGMCSAAVVCCQYCYLIGVGTTDRRTDTRAYWLKDSCLEGFYFFSFCVLGPLHRGWPYRCGAGRRGWDGMGDGPVSVSWKSRVHVHTAGQGITRNLPTPLPPPR